MKGDGLVGRIIKTVVVPDGYGKPVTWLQSIFAALVVYAQCTQNGFKGFRKAGVVVYGIAATGL